MDWTFVIIAILLALVVAGVIIWYFRYKGQFPVITPASDKPHEKVEPKVGGYETPGSAAHDAQSTNTPEPDTVSTSGQSGSVPVTPSQPEPVSPEAVHPEFKEKGKSHAVDQPVEAEEVLFEDGLEGLPVPDKIVDEVFKVTFNHPVPGKRLLDRLKDLDQFKDTVNVKVFAFEENQKRWFKPDAIGIFSSLVIYLPLASRVGFLSPLQLAKFNQVLEGLQIQLGGTSDALDMPSLEKRATNLGKVVTEFSAQISLLLQLATPTDVARFEEVAHDLRFKRVNEHHYEKIGDLILTPAGKRIGNRRGTIAVEYVNENCVVLSLLVGLTNPENDPLRDYVLAANAFAAKLDATIVNAGGSELNNSMLTTVRKELKAFYEGMRAAGVEPGSATAHRLLG